MIIPYDQLSQSALNGVIDDWLSRQTQQANDESDTENAHQIAHAKLASGEWVVTWDSESQTLNIQPKDIAQASVNEYSGY